MQVFDGGWKCQTVTRCGRALPRRCLLGVGVGVVAELHAATRARWEVEGS